MSSTNKVNMSLDDIIKQNKKNKRGDFKGRGKFQGGRGRGRGGRGGRNRFQEGKMDRNYPKRNFGERRRYLNKNNDSGAQGSDSGAEEKRTRLFVSNLQKEIVNSELRKIFSSVGPLKRCQIHWDEMGFSKGTAEIEYERPEDAKKAIKDYNEADVEGVLMKVEYAKGGSRGNRRGSGSRSPRRGGRAIRGSKTTLRNAEKRQFSRGGPKPLIKKRLGLRNKRRNQSN